MGWGDVTGWVPQGGAFLGTKRTLPQKYMKTVAARFKEHKIQVGSTPAELSTAGGADRCISTADLHQQNHCSRCQEQHLVTFGSCDTCFMAHFGHRTRCSRWFGRMRPLLEVFSEDKVKVRPKKVKFSNL